MKTTNFILLLTLSATLLFFTQCKKDNETDDNSNVEQSVISDVTYSPNNEGIVKVVTNNETGDKFYFYGTWNNNDSIEKYTELLFQKSANDTSIVFKLNETGDTVTQAYFNVGNQPQNTLLTFEYLETGEIKINSFEYDWATQNAVFIEQFQVYDGVVLKTEGNLLFGLPSIPPGIREPLRAVAGLAVLGAIGVACPPCLGYGIAAGLLWPEKGFSSTANNPAPPNAPKPAQQNVPNTPPATPCNNLTATETLLNVDTLGYTCELLITPSGGTPPYTFLWNDGSTTSTYVFTCGGSPRCKVTDAKGCVYVW
jgi:hypothetical protein